MKKLLIITGPQGSGNHLFSRLLSLHPDVGGWDDLLDEYWVPSDLEPFAEYWVNPEKIVLSLIENRGFPVFFNRIRARISGKNMQLRQDFQTFYALNCLEYL